MHHVNSSNRRIARSLALFAIASVAFVAGVQARSSDRSQLMNLGSDRQSGSLDENSVNTLSGNVVITQGTLDIRAGKADIYQRGGEPVRAVMTGSPVILKQQMDDGSPMTAKADRIEYDMVADVILLIGNYTVTTPRGSTNGQRLTYDLKSGRIESGGQGNGRVTMTIQPKAKQAPKPVPAPQTQKPN
jgi:lipopolysaccharide export system protein LptA